MILERCVAMNKILSLFGYFWTAFCQIVTGVLCVTTLYILVFWGHNIELGIEILWQILLVSAICTLGCFFLYCPQHELSKMGFLCRICVLFVYINCIVLGSGSYFQWFYFSNWKMVAGMEFCIILVFAATILFSFCNGKKQADTMNEKLRERQG